MVQGLGFLSKKSWHTKNLANQEKVWMAEQRKDAEAQKTKELAKQIQQEREQEELDKLSGKKSATLDRGIDWMYQNGGGNLAKEDNERKAEEFLLGKEYVGEGATQGDFDNGDQDQGINHVVAQAAPEEAAVADLGPSVKDRNEDFRLRVEDPMFMVSQKQREKVVQHEKNQALYDRVVGNDEESDHEDRRKSKSDRKRRREAKKSRRDDEDRRRRRHRRRSRSPERHRKRSPSYDRSDDSSDHERRRSRRDEGSRRRRDSHDHSRERRDYDKRGHRETRRDEHKRGSRHYDNHDRHRSEYDRHEERERGGRSSPVDSKRSHHSDQHRPVESMKKEGYGLKGAKKPSTEDQGYLGPSRDLLAKKRSERDEELRRIRETASRRRTTGAERAKALEEMQSNARQRDETRKQASHRSNRKDEGEPTLKTDASFLKDITQQAHGIGGDVQSLSSRVAQNRHTNQRLHESFL